MTLNEIKSTEKNNILIHSVVWCFFICSSLIQFYESPFYITPDFFIQWGTGIVLFYLNYFYFVPRLLLQKKYGSYLAIVLLIIFVFMAFRMTYTISEFRDMPRPNALITSRNGQLPLEPHFKNKRPFIFRLLPAVFYIFILACSIVIKTLSEIYTSQQNKLVAETHRTSAELNYLRKQTNPHFLFNALNSIYSLAYKKSDLVPDAIVTLSEMMRYMLYETDNKSVFLEKELNYIKNYIELQKLRLSNIENIFINIHGDTKNKYIEPLLLITFIENAFKYGTDYKGVTYVKIKIIIEENTLDFWIENKIENYTKDPNNSGIGMTNMENRLNLLYPNAHKLTIIETTDKYSLHLNLKLDQLKE